MLHRVILISIGLIASTLLMTAHAQAGAWPRKQGTAFVSTSVELSWPKDVAKWTSSTPTKDYSSAYLEYGLSDTVTLGLDIGRSTSGAGQTLLFFQIPIGSRTRGRLCLRNLGLA